MTEDSPAFVFVRFRALRRKGPFRRFSARYPSRCSIGRSDGGGIRAGAAKQAQVRRRTRFHPEPVAGTGVAPARQAEGFTAVPLRSSGQ